VGEGVKANVDKGGRGRSNFANFCSTAVTKGQQS